MVASPRSPGHWTYREYLLLEDDKRYEIIEGELREMTPAPSTRHQSVSRNLEFLFLAYVREHNWGVVYDAPVDVILREDTVLEPDIVLVASGRKDIIRERGIFGAPDLVVEIVSPSSVHYDYLVKKELYQRHGVREYWIVDPAHHSIDVLALEEGQFASVCFINGKGRAVSRLLEGFEVELEGVFSPD